MIERRTTEEELVEMEGYKGSLYARAAAEIRELVDDNARLRGALVTARDTLKACDVDPSWIDDALKETDDE